MRLDEYLDLVTSQHRRDRFRGTVATAVAPLASLQDAVHTDLATAFDLDTAVGVQLDRIGQWVGRSRHLTSPIEDVYFSWNVAGVGWSEGYWRGRYDPISGIISLPDEPYRRVLRAKIAANSWDGTIPGAYSVWDAAFAVGDDLQDMSMVIDDLQDMSMVIDDLQDMSMVIGLAGGGGDKILAALLREGAIPLKPEGVRIRYYSVTAPTRPIFAWSARSDALGGWNEADWADKVYLEVV